MSEEYDDYGYDDSPGIGCCNCEQGWIHGCMDDMCRSCEQAAACPDAHACRCNPDCELPW